MFWGYSTGLEDHFPSNKLWCNGDPQPYLLNDVSRKENAMAGGGAQYPSQALGAWGSPGRRAACRRPAAPQQAGQAWSSEGSKPT